MKLLGKILFLAILMTNTSVFADNDSNKERFKDYDSSYYLDEGKLLFKFRPLFSYVNAKQSGIDKLTANNPSAKKPGDIINNGFGFDTSTTYFFADHLATELSIGVTYYKAKKQAFSDMAVLFGNSNVKVGKKIDIFMVPVSGTIQYHIAPFGAVRPYIGAGIHGTYAYSRAKEYSIESGVGGVIQAGVDFVSRDDTLITLDVRGYSLESKLNYKKEFTGGKEYSTKVKWNPVVVALGFGFIF